MALEKFQKIGFEHKLMELYRKFEEGRITLSVLAKEMGVSLREAYDMLEKKGLPASNISLKDRLAHK